MLSPKSACFRIEACPWETFELCSVKWFVLQHQSLGAYLKIYANEICNIYDKHMHLQPPFQIFRNIKYKGVEDLMCGNVGETN